MNKPTEYKSLTYSEVESRQGVNISEQDKQSVYVILQKFVDLFKQKHL